MEAQTEKALKYILALAFLNLAAGAAKNIGRILDPHVPAMEVPRDIALYLIITLSAFYWFHSALSVIAKGIGWLYAAYTITPQWQGLALFAILALSPLSGYIVWKHLDGTGEGKKFLFAYLAFALTSGLGMQIFSQG